MAKKIEAVPLRRLQPKLRMIANGDTDVNTLRAEYASSVKVSAEVAKSRPILRDDDAVPTPSDELPKSERTRKLTGRAQAEVSVFVHLTEDLEDPRATVKDKVPGTVTARKGNLVTAEMRVSEVLSVAGRSGKREPVDYAELGQTLATPEPDVASGGVKAPASALRRFGTPRKHGYGAGVLIGLIDVGGFDFSHPDFLDRDGKTRFVRIWDQAEGMNRPPPGKVGSSEFAYGSELRQAELNAAIAAAPKRNVPAFHLEPQAQMAAHSHATHVASIAAGNRGVCRRAMIAGVSVSIPESDTERRLSFYDSTRVAHGIDYLLELGRELGDIPVSINISLGTNGHAHDDSSAIARWIDAALSRPGRSVCVAAGNAGQERPEFDGDSGYVMGRIHTSGKIASRGLKSDLEWNVVGNGTVDISENELEIWYGAQDRFAVQVKPPNEPWTEVVEPGQFIENRELKDRTFLSVYNELFHPANGANYISVFLSPRLGRTDVVGVHAGQWLVRVIGRDVRDGSYHGWIERDDPRRLGRIGEREAWAFPSFFSEHSYVDNSTVSSLACGDRLISVANLDAFGRKVNVSSSQGPTRDGRQKPDVAAPGTDIIAASGFTPEQEWVSMTGTSMASPHVCGLAGLMLAVNPRLTAAQVEGILERTTETLPGTNYAWRDDSGAGVLAEERAIAEAEAMQVRVDITEADER